MVYDHSAFYTNGQAKYIKIYASQPKNASTDYLLLFATVKKGQFINITLHSIDAAIDASQEKYIKNIVDTAVFDTPTSQTVSSTQSPVSSRYTDPDTNAYFTVPAGWTVQTPSIKENGVQMMFISDTDPTKTIIYACQDLWEQMSESERSGYTRKDINISTFTEMDLVMIAMELKISASDIQNVTYDFTKYYKIPEVFEAVGSATPFSDHSTALVTIQNGYIYQFYFTDTDASPAFADLEKLLESAYFPGANTVSSAGTIGGIPGGTAATPSPRSGSLTLSGLLGILFSLIVTILVYSLPIFIYRFGIKKEPVPPKKGLLITLVYAVFAFIAMCVLLFLLNGSPTAGGALFLWSFINYKMLTKGYVEPLPASQPWPQDGAYSNPADADLSLSKGEADICDFCGFSSPLGSRFCGRCGKPFERGEDKNGEQ